MRTFSYTPKRQNDRPVWWLSFLTVGLIVSVLYCVFGWWRPLVGQIAFFLFAVADIWLYSRFFFLHYTYTVTLMNGVPTLIVNQRRGNQTTTVCQRELSDLSEIREFRRGENGPRELRVDVRMNFLVSMSPSVWQTLYFILDDGECVSVTLEVDKSFLTVLREALTYLNLEVEGAEVCDETNSVAESAPEPQTV